VIEPLESRELFDLSILNAHTAKYTDVDGDKVTITISTGDFHDAIVSLVDRNLGDYLESIILPSTFSGANISFAVTKALAGNGRADVGLIDATGVDLGNVSIRGDLGRILAGSGDALIPAVESISAASMGARGLNHQPGGATLPLESVFDGKLGRLNISGNANNVDITADSAGRITIGGFFIGGGIETTGDVERIAIARNLVGTQDNNSANFLIGGNIDSFFVGGSIIGGAGDSSALVSISGHAKTITIAGSIIGGSGAVSGGINSSIGDFDSVRIGGNVRGGSGSGSGYVQTRGLCKILAVGGSVIGASGIGSGSVDAWALVFKIGGSIRGGSGERSGVGSTGHSTLVSIGGSIIGGTASDSGQLFGGYITRAVIGGNIVGGNVNGTDSISKSGAFLAWSISKLEVRGSIRAGVDNSAGTLERCGAVCVLYAAENITVRGSIIGSVGKTGDVTQALIAASGPFFPGDTNVAIGTLAVGGSVERANILAGYQSFNVQSVDIQWDNAQIGRVSIAGDLIASNIVAGVINSASTNTNFGDENDECTDTDDFDPYASINMVSVGGKIRGTAVRISGTDHFGIVAKIVKAVRIGGNLVALNPDMPDDVSVGPSGDFSIHEV
jgi:hypothetical protein